MNKQEFLDILKDSLVDQVNENEIRNQIAYYDEYISGGNVRGLSEQEVIDEIGDPRLIARTIIDTVSLSRDPMKKYYNEKDHTYSNNQNRDEKEDRKRNFVFNTRMQLKWYQWILVLLVIVVVIGVVLALAFSVITIFFVYIFPVLIFVFVIRIMIGLFRSR